MASLKQKHERDSEKLCPESIQLRSPRDETPKDALDGHDETQEERLWT